MTLYICQCPHRLPARIWTADNEIAALDLLDAEDGTSLEVAIADDMRDAFATTDPLELFLWINHAAAPQATRARNAYLRSRELRHAVEALARPIENDDDVCYSAFDARFTWSETDQVWTLDNQPPVEADDLFAALCDASLILGQRERMEQTDV